jgi:hypothetical protein
MNIGQKTLDEDKQNKKHNTTEKTKKMSNMDSTNKPGVNVFPAKGKQSLHITRFCI